MSGGTYFSKSTREFRATLPTDGRGHLIFDVNDPMHIELGMPTPEDCRTEELADIEKLMSQPPVPLSCIGYAHNKWMSKSQGEIASGAVAYRGYRRKR